MSGISWKDFILELDPRAELGEPVPDERIVQAEKALGGALPEELREFLLEVGTVTWEAMLAELWSIEDIEEQNVQFRTYEDFKELYMPFDHLLFFGADGCGDMYCYAIDGDRVIRRNDIFMWDHETDARNHETYGLRRFLTEQVKQYRAIEKMEEE